MRRTQEGDNFGARLDNLAGRIYLDSRKLGRVQAEKAAKEEDMKVKGTFDKEIISYECEISGHLRRLDELVEEVDASSMGNGHGQKEKIYRSAIDVYQLAPR